jgi:hypothetical protein
MAQDELVILPPERQARLEVLSKEAEGLTLREFFCQSGELMLGTAGLIATIFACDAREFWLWLVSVSLILAFAILAVWHRHLVGTRRALAAERTKIADSAGGCELMDTRLQSLANQVASRCRRALQCTEEPAERLRIYRVRFDAIMMLMEIDQKRAPRGNFKHYMLAVDSLCTDIIQHHQRKALGS